ncbi:RnfH family protein [Ottowia caeni]|uniref:RnfH family protein n=1 Tax=Ottowia caeni TaxID=2870339 RepID=UPI001E2F4F74|nr:RnfH family protein [Ottowia caeni]
MVNIAVTVAYSHAPRQVCVVQLAMPTGSTVGQAVEGSGLLARFPDLQIEHGSVGIWGRKTALDHPLRDQDRVEIWRALKVDPKVARRERFKKQGASSAGLFAQRRSGAKSGY